jgi:hypothetical protein
VHGNASIEGDYVLRAAVLADERGEGLALCHSHPGSRGWQAMSAPDFDAESSFANLVRELTGHPLVGITYASGDRSWSARHWDQGTGPDVTPTHSDSVRVLGDSAEPYGHTSGRRPPRHESRTRRAASPATIPRPGTHRAKSRVISRVTGGSLL